MKKPLPLSSRFLALWLTLALALPAPSFALRETQTVDSGLEERQLAEALRGSTAAGAEEVGPGQGYPANLDPKVIQRVVQSARDLYRFDEEETALLTRFLEGGISLEEAK